MLLYGPADGRTGAVCGGDSAMSRKIAGGSPAAKLFSICSACSAISCCWVNRRAWVIPGACWPSRRRRICCITFRRCSRFWPSCATRTELIGQSLDKVLFHKLLVDPEVMSRVVHVWLASFAVTGVLTSWIAWRQREIDGDDRARRSNPRAKRDRRTNFDCRHARASAGRYLGAHVAAGECSKIDCSAAIGSRPTIFGLAIFTSFGLMHHLAKLALRRSFRTRRLPSARV